MPLSVSSQIEDNVAVLELKGALTLGPSLNLLREAARAALDSQKLVGIILRLAGVTIVDTSGLGELTVVYTFAARRSCSIVLVDVSQSLRKMLEMTRLEAILPSAPDLVSAKKQFRSARA